MTRHPITPLLAALVLLIPVSATGVMKLSEAAEAFGSRPGVWRMRLSPDGQRVSFLVEHSSGIPVAMVHDLRRNNPRSVLASEKDGRLNIQWCDWKNDSRLLCGYYGVTRYRGRPAGVTRLVAVNDDGSNITVLAQKQQQDEISFWQSAIVDWLPNQHSRILLEIREGAGRGVGSVDIDKNRIKTVERANKNVWSWMSDGHGNLVLRYHLSDRGTEWRYRPAEDEPWARLHFREVGDRSSRFWPAGFGEDRSKLLAWDQHEGRRALWSFDLAHELKRELVYSHPKFDLGALVHIGKYRRFVGVSYSSTKPEVVYFDAEVQSVRLQIEAELPGMVIFMAGESWDHRYYLVHASRDTESGTYYRFDTHLGKIDRITDNYPRLRDVQLGHVRAIEYPSDDGVLIPAYLTLPPGPASDKPRATILLPHGGPHSRDEWGFDFLSQFLASRGYAVLQSNYRGSSGYGEAWAGEGAYKGWRRAITDLEFGLRYLVAEGIADPNRICTVGWSFGGYAALMSAIEYPDRYRCVVSIAGVSDLQRLISEARAKARRFIGNMDDEVKSMIGSDPEVIQRGSPERRAEELGVPVLLFHGDLDRNVSIGHSRRMKKALPKKRVELIEYEDADHSIAQSRHRVDMLNRIGKFLESNLPDTNASE